MPARLILVIRRSPDWRALAAVHARGAAIDPGAFAPATRVPAFPATIAACVAALRGLVLPAHAKWMREPIARTAELLAAALPSAIRLPFPA